jgi:hypothetical protein
VSRTKKQKAPGAKKAVGKFDKQSRIPGYINRYCAFIDILGFRGLVRELQTDVSRFVKLQAALTKIHWPVNAPKKDWTTDFRVQSISDAVAISTIANLSGLTHLFKAIETLAIDLLKEGYLIRGALVKGMLYHDDHMVFGDALVRAYELESTIARYPRVMVTRDIIDEINHSTRGFFREQREQYEIYLEQADDGPHYVHVLRNVASEISRIQIENLNLRPEKRHSLEEYERMRDTIQKRLGESVDNPRHFEKVQWFARYWNKCSPYIPVTGPGMDVVTWRANVGPPQND